MLSPRSMDLSQLSAYMLDPSLIDKSLTFCSCRFRIQKVAVTADIERAFLMIAMTEKDCDVLWFLWIDDVSKPNPYCGSYVLCFGVSSSPFLLNATIQHHSEKHAMIQPDLVSKLLRSTYVCRWHCHWCCVSSGGALTSAGTSMFTMWKLCTHMKCEVKNKWDMGMGHLWLNLNGWSIFHLMGRAFMA